MNEINKGADQPDEMPLISKDFFMSAYSGDNDFHLTPYVGCPVAHRDTKRPLVSSL